MMENNISIQIIKRHETSSHELRKTSESLTHLQAFTRQQMYIL